MSAQRELLFDVQRKELERVSGRIAALIVQFCRERLASNPQFHVDELRSYIGAVQRVAPDSPRRVMSELRTKGVVAYECIDRAASLYRVIKVAA